MDSKNNLDDSDVNDTIEQIELTEISKKTGKPKIKRNYTDEHKQKMRDSMRIALEVRRANIIERKKLKEIEAQEHEEKKQQLKKVYEKTKANKKSKELKDIAYELLTKNNDSDDDDVIEEVIIKKQPKNKAKPRPRSKTIIDDEEEEHYHPAPIQQQPAYIFY